MTPISRRLEKQKHTQTSKCTTLNNFRLKLLRADVPVEQLPAGCSITDLVPAVNVKEKIEVNGGYLRCFELFITKSIKLSGQLDLNGC